MDHPIGADGGYGYQNEFDLGYPWTSQVAGTEPVTIWFDSTHFDHRTWLNSAAPPNPTGFSYGLNWVLDTASGNPRYGFERFGQQMDRCGTLDTSQESVTYAQSIQNTKIKVDFNRPWGNSIGRITWMPASENRQIVEEDIGAMVQGDLQIGLPNDAIGCCSFSPQESGGALDPALNYGVTQGWAGSPIISSTPNPTTSMTTVVKPLNAIHDAFTGEVNLFDVLLWKGLFTRTTTLGYTMGGALYDDVIQLQWGAKLDDASMDSYSVYQGAGMHLDFWHRLNAWGDYRYVNFEWFDAQNSTSTAITPLFGTSIYKCNVLAGQPCSPGQAVIAYNGLFAAGFIRKDTATDVADQVSILWICGGTPSANGTYDCADGNLYEPDDPRYAGNPSFAVGFGKGKNLHSSDYEYNGGFLVLGDSVATVRTRLHSIYCSTSVTCTP